jgi:hypothetical protein
VLIRQFIKDESGMTMGLVVIMILLIGVMGAGLLTFVQRDLEAVVEVNKGQKAFEMADAGVQLAKRQLRRDPLSTHYDLDDVLGSVVSPVCDVPAAQAVLNGVNLEDPSLFPLLGGNWAPNPINPTQGGVTKSNLDGVSSTADTVHVQIIWANPGADPNSPAEKLCAAPDSSPPAGTTYFRILSTGEYNGAKRKVEAYYEVYDLGVPKAYFAKQNASMSGTATIANTSVFSLGNISVSNGAELIGTDVAYGDWYNEDFNLVRRRTALGLPMTLSGLGAHGAVSAPSALNVTGRNHGNLAYPQPTPPSSTQMTFPFNPDAEPDLDVLKQEAIEQQNETGETHYYASNGGLVRIGSPGELRWPSNSTYRTVVFVEYTQNGNNRVSWQEDGSCLTDPITGLISGSTKKGTVVVKGGDFTMQGYDAPFEGIVVVRGGVYEDGDYSGQGNSCLKGYANTSGMVTLAGNASPSNLLDVSTRAGFYGVRLWSWRECYNTSCT